MVLSQLSMSSSSVDQVFWRAGLWSQERDLRRRLSISYLSYCAIAFTIISIGSSTSFSRMLWWRKSLRYCSGASVGWSAPLSDLFGRACLSRMSFTTAIWSVPLFVISNSGSGLNTWKAYIVSSFWVTVKIWGWAQNQWNQSILRTA